jgi:hypothetical protein
MKRELVAMIETAFCRMLSRVVVSLSVAGRDQGLANRRWQDESRNVRPADTPAFSTTRETLR